MNLTCREALASELQDLLRLYRQLNPADPEPDPQAAEALFSQMRENTMTRILVAHDGEKSLSTCTLVVVPNLTRNLEPYAVIENVVTDAKSRGQGAGKAVMSHAIEEAWKAGCYKVMLMTGTQREGTIAFYESLGFRADSKTGLEIRRP
ncbi:GNAT family N-acetyltransferase [Denitrobaculum tricleocarpae]|uniref:GNAT family N-acetyltransferase n=1 Tax=Denitrobaculum tricleocarpae TaxID=2591009 RepID=A0A545TKQ7_9PROT|nr:GNAT family N-acetyltransferase [Denitrobaculum tricleocarpae]TQV77776.1 GNAT family N-acetyltransferase [Denitrobaculum tricleocarpae]